MELAADNSATTYLFENASGAVILTKPPEVKEAEERVEKLYTELNRKFPKWQKMLDDSPKEN